MDHPAHEQLLDPSPDVAAHLQACSGCAAEAEALDRRRRALRSLPPLPPASAAWSNLQSTVTRARRRRVAVRSAALAVAATLAAVVFWPARAPAPVVDELIARSQGLEEELRALPEPSVVDVAEANDRAELEDEITWVDQCLAGLEPAAPSSERAALWRSRIELLKSLLDLRRPPAVLVSL